MFSKEGINIMIKKLLFSLALVVIFVFTPMQNVYAQMMGNMTSGVQNENVIPSAADLRDIQEGKVLYGKFQNKQITCTKLNNSDYEKIGEYLMNQRFGGDSKAHIQINNTMKQMMGEKGEEQMHVLLAKSVTGCGIKKQGGDNKMMNFGYTGMMGWNNGFSLLPLLIHLVILVDLTLAGVWLWKKIGDKK